MSQQSLATLLTRVQADPIFAQQLIESPDQVLAGSGFDLDPQERMQLQQQLAAWGPTITEMAFQRRLMHDRLSEQVKRVNELSAYSVQILKNTLDTAKDTYRRITFMNLTMFVVGIALFVAAAVSAALSRRQGTLLFGGLGVATFVSLFILRPIRNSQAALSNLVQAQVCFMNFYEQMTFWESYAFLPVVAATPGMPSTIDPSNVATASENLQARSTQTMELLQKYLESNSP